MLKNYLTLAWRNLLRQKVYSFINIAGLSLGIATCLVIILYISDELGYDRFLPHAEDIYRLESLYTVPEGENPWASTAGPAVDVARTVPEVMNATHLFVPPQQPVLRYKDKQFREENLYFADSAFFSVLPLPFLKGNPKTALAEPNALVISEDMARKYFGTTDALDRVLTTDTREYHVRGILKKLHQGTHLQIECLVSLSTFSPTVLAAIEQWGSNSFYTYARLRPGVDVHAAEQHLDQAVGRAGVNAQGGGIVLHLHAHRLTDIHLDGNIEREIAPNGSRSSVYILTAIALLILLLACINYMNLATARSMNRSKEVGVRKALGAGRSALIRQFLIESVLVVILSMACALLLCEITLPFFNALTGKELILNPADPLLMSVIAGIIIVVGIGAGAYPAFFLSAFQPVRVLKEHFSKGSSSSILFRSVLVVLQFAISIFLILASFIQTKQVDYMLGASLGFDKSHVLILPITASAMKSIAALKDELQKTAHAVSVSATSDIPGKRVPFLNVAYEGADANRGTSMRTMLVDQDFVRTMGMKVKQGRDFSTAIASDSSGAYILNEAAVASFGWKEAVGKTFEFDPGRGSGPGTVIGVVENFHFTSLHSVVEPVVLHVTPGVHQYIAIRLPAGHLPILVEGVRKVWREVLPSQPFDYFFLDENFDALYRSEIKLRTISEGFTVLAMIIACLGLYGLIAFTTQQRTKEIGIRKVLGATVSGIVLLLTKDFLKLVGYAFLIAAPLAYLLMNSWLENFAYRIEIRVGIFLLVGVAAVIIAWATVSYQSIKAALANPVKALKYE